MITRTKDKKILAGFSLTSNTPWREAINQSTELAILEAALLLADSKLEERRELYNLLKETSVESLPFVQLSLNMENWELDYLTQNYKTEVFSLPPENRTLSFLTRLVKHAPQFVFENPAKSQSQNLFTNETLTRSGVTGVCLDTVVLERDRQNNKKKYNTTIHTLDQHTPRATKIGPVPNAWYKKIIKGQDRRLTSLSELSYLKYLPPTYLAPLVILAVDNLIDEQLEIKAYLESFWK